MSAIIYESEIAKVNFDTKQIGGTEDKLRLKNNIQGLPAAKFTIPEKGLVCIVYSMVQESEVGHFIQFNHGKIMINLKLNK